MALPTPTGKLNTETGTVEPNNTGMWSDLSGTTWNSWSSWVNEPADPMIWLTNVLDLQETIDFCLQISTVANGTVSYSVYVSDTGAFAGEETTTNIASGATGVAGFTGRYVIIAANVARTNGINTLYGVDVRASNNSINIRLNNIDTSTLAGTSSERTLVLPRAVSKIVNMEITPHELASAYTLDLYVSSTQTSKQVVPKIVSKSISTPKIALVGLDNQPRNATVDVLITALPEQYMDGNDLKTR